VSLLGKKDMKGWPCDKILVHLKKIAPINFAINGKYSKNFYANPNYYASIVMFQTYNNVVLRSVHLCLGACFDYVLPNYSIYSYYTHTIS
jgi:hypothetical protein